jgi:hypothetical protein
MLPLQKSRTTMFLPLAAVSALEGDQIVDVAIDEELANTGDIRPLATVLREIVLCKKTDEKTQCHYAGGWRG